MGVHSMNAKAVRLDASAMKMGLHTIILARAHTHASFHV